MAATVHYLPVTIMAVTPVFRDCFWGGKMGLSFLKLDAFISHWAAALGHV